MQELHVEATCVCSSPVWARSWQTSEAVNAHYLGNTIDLFRTGNRMDHCCGLNVCVPRKFMEALCLKVMTFRNVASGK